MQHLTRYAPHTRPCADVEAHANVGDRVYRMVVVRICSDHHRVPRPGTLERDVRRPQRISVHAARLDMGARNTADCIRRPLCTQTLELCRETNSVASARIRHHLRRAGRSSPRDTVGPYADARDSPVLGDLSLLR